jgi:fused signal recognition particle receptor
MVFWRKKPVPSVSSLDSQPESAERANDGPRDGVEASAIDGNEASKSQPDSEPGGWFKSLRSALKKTNQILKTDIRDLWKSDGRLVDEDFLRELFSIMVRSDIGQPTAARIRDRIATEFRGRKVEMPLVLASAREEIRAAMQSKSTALQFAASGPTVILVVGVNGAGKTTSIAKLAYRLTQQGRRVLLGAGDTFRAAAVEQLKIWSERIGCAIVLGEQGGDPGAVAYKAILKAREENFDVCIIDTAGRLQTQTNLMQQLDKIRKIATKQIEGAPHEVLLVLDATAGQNAISQARGFSQSSGCTGIILAKLDGTAKGGVIVPILQEFGLPVKLIGLGEKLSDMAEFNADDFTAALLDFDE